MNMYIFRVPFKVAVCPPCPLTKGKKCLYKKYIIKTEYVYIQSAFQSCGLSPVPTDEE